MLKLKKKAEEKKIEDAIAASEASMDMDMKDDSTVGVPGGLKLLGVGGKEVRKDGAKKTKKTTPGEIRIQKDIAELDAGDVASVEFPNPKDLTSFNVFVSPDQGDRSDAASTRYSQQCLCVNRVLEGCQVSFYFSDSSRLPSYTSYC